MKKRRLGKMSYPVRWCYSWTRVWAVTVRGAPILSESDGFPRLPSGRLLRLALSDCYWQWPRHLKQRFFR